MAELHLEQNESVILESDGVIWLNRDRIRLQSMILTNKKIYLVDVRRNSRTSKPLKHIIAFPLHEIRVIDGELMVTQVKNLHVGTYLQIEMIQGKEKFVFEDLPTPTSAEWVETLHDLLSEKAEKKERWLLRGTWY